MMVSYSSVPLLNFFGQGERRWREEGWFPLASKLNDFGPNPKP